MHKILILSVFIVVVSSDCVHEGKTYTSGQSFSTSPCVHCVCDPSGQTLCLASACMMPQCVDATHDPKQCCPVCPNGANCRHTDGTIIKKGDVYHPDSNTSCMCPDSNFMISTQSAICAVAAPAPCSDC